MLFLRKQLSEAAQPESRMRNRDTRRGELQRDDYVVRMLRISRILGLSLAEQNDGR